MLLFADLDGVSVKDSRFNAKGDGITDDTLAIQAAIDVCFGPAGAPNGANSTKNKTLLFPPGHYATTAPLLLTSVQGGRLLGSGRLTTIIRNRAGSGVFVSNGLSYSLFADMQLWGIGTATVFDLNWDNTGPVSLQENVFDRVLFTGGAIGCDIGRGDFMGSENEFRTCFFGGNTIAGLKTSNFNALQNTIIGGNIAGCGVGAYAQRGSISILQTGMQGNGWDFQMDNSANDAVVLQGIRSESANFARVTANPTISISGISHIGPPGGFIVGRALASIRDSVSVAGTVKPQYARYLISMCSFGRTDALDLLDIGDGSVRLMESWIGRTPNGVPLGQYIIDQRWPLGP